MFGILRTRTPSTALGEAYERNKSDEFKGDTEAFMDSLVHDDFYKTVLLTIRVPMVDMDETERALRHLLDCGLETNGSLRYNSSSVKLIIGDAAINSIIEENKGFTSFKHDMIATPIPYQPTCSSVTLHAVLMRHQYGYERMPENVLDLFAENDDACDIIVGEAWATLIQQMRTGATVNTPPTNRTDPFTHYHCFRFSSTRICHLVDALIQRVNGWSFQEFEHRLYDHPPSTSFITCCRGADVYTRVRSEKLNDVCKLSEMRKIECAVIMSDCFLRSASTVAQQCRAQQKNATAPLSLSSSSSSSSSSTTNKRPADDNEEANNDETVPSKRQQLVNNNTSSTSSATPTNTDA